MNSATTAVCAMELIMSVCNASSTMAKGDSYIYTGNPSEVALSLFVEENRKGRVHALRAEYPTQFQIPFNSTNKFHVVVVAGQIPSLSSLYDSVCNKDTPHSGTCMMKGAPEVLITRCTHVLHDGEIHLLDEKDQRIILEAYNQFARRGQRVLGFCFKPLGLPDNFASMSHQEKDRWVPLSDMIFAGLVSIMDPPRDDVPKALQQCFSASIRVAMVTGDHPTTASSIAQQIGPNWTDSGSHEVNEIID